MSAERFYSAATAQNLIKRLVRFLAQQGAPAWAALRERSPIQALAACEHDRKERVDLDEVRRRQFRHPMSRLAFATKAPGFVGVFPRRRPQPALS